MARAAAITVALVLLGCGPDRSASGKPAGTIADPVEVCEESAQVCRFEGSKLGVCTHRESGDGLVCTSQH